MIFLDMDGVLADFTGYVKTFGIDNDHSFLHKPHSEWTPAEIALDLAVRDLMDSPDFWPNLPVMPGAHELVSAAFARDHVNILSAYPRVTKNKSMVIEQKTDWAVRNLHIPSYYVRIVARDHKQEYARTNSARHKLVDDMHINCQEWEQAGGHAILYQNADQAIKQLKGHYSE